MVIIINHINRKLKTKYIIRIDCFLFDIFDNIEQ